MQQKSFLTLILTISFGIAPSASFGLTMLSSSTIYGIPNSGWSSPSWNWGSASGTGHDCAAICRQVYSTRSSRENLVQDLISTNSSSESTSNNTPSFEEVTLILGLAFQNGRWDGSDGGKGGYGEVLSLMAAADRYETGSEEQRAKNFIQDLQARYHLLKPNPNDQSLMDQQLDEADLEAARRRCSGLVLRAMGFVEKGL
eukprot:scaffold14558_cov137-Cylindrotheca_fusiformis.AAC.15